MTEKKVVKKKKEMHVSDLIITDEFKTLSINSKGKEAAEELMGIPRGVVLVINESQEPKGVITAREFLKKIVEGVNPVEVDVGALMNTDILPIKISAKLDDVVPEVTKRDPYAVVVIDDDGKFKGYFSPKDYQEALARINYIKR
jgi:CBS-domain-containing membrane protein